MNIREHFDKGQKIEKSMKKVSLPDDYEAVIEICMLAGTHYYNGALHKLKITNESYDMIHTWKPVLDVELNGEILLITKRLRYIEDLRPFHLKGDEGNPGFPPIPGKPYDDALGKEIINSFITVKEMCKQIINDK